MAAALLVTAACTTQLAAQPAGQPGASPGASAPSPSALPSPRAARPDIEPEAMAALERMGAYLRSLPAFTVRAHSSTDKVLDSGQKIREL
jgi:hypothetical protein